MILYKHVGSHSPDLQSGGSSGGGGGGEEEYDDDNTTAVALPAAARVKASKRIYVIEWIVGAGIVRGGGGPGISHH